MATHSPGDKSASRHGTPPSRRSSRAVRIAAPLVTSLIAPPSRAFRNTPGRTVIATARAVGTRASRSAAISLTKLVALTTAVCPGSKVRDHSGQEHAQPFVEFVPVPRTLGRAERAVGVGQQT